MPTEATPDRHTEVALTARRRPPSAPKDRRSHDGGRSAHRDQRRPPRASVWPVGADQQGGDLLPLASAALASRREMRFEVITQFRELPARERPSPADVPIIWRSRAYGGPATCTLAVPYLGWLDFRLPNSRRVMRHPYGSERPGPVTTASSARSRPVRSSLVAA